ncbi:MAG: flavodoxin family protein [Oscillospiraceae bacterium]|nr:flavodoxin family protein [Oscillospiraceae bacterium]
MSHILAFTASARAGSVSSRLVQLAAETASAKGHTVEIIDLTAPQLQCCKGCGYCRTNDGCSIKDGFFDKIVGCDGIIAGFPIYFSGIAGQGKVFIDRLYPMMDAGFVPRHPGKKVIAIYAQGDSNEKQFISSINFVNYAFRLSGWKLLDSVLCAGTAVPGFEVSESIITRVKDAAEKL